MSLFVEDEDIIVTKSPFSAYEGESKKFDGRVNNISIDHIMIKVKREEVFGIDFDIIEAISELEFATSRMITQFLMLRNIHVDQSKIQDRLKFLNRLMIISRYKVINDESEVNTRIYCLEKVGKYLLQSREISCKWLLSDSARPLYIMKRILARNQILLTYKTRLKNIEKSYHSPYLKVMATQRDFKTDLQICFDTDGVKDVMLFEVARSYEGCMEKTLETLKAYKEYIEYFQPTPQILQPPKLVIVGEDDKHLLEIFKQVLKNSLIAPNLEFLYTTDLRVIGEDLSRSIVQLGLVSVDGTPTNVKPRFKEMSFSLLK
jgi:DNA-binding Lrp family transcriptional regulator